MDLNQQILCIYISYNVIIYGCSGTDFRRIYCCSCIVVDLSYTPHNIHREALFTPVEIGVSIRLKTLQHE